MSYRKLNFCMSRWLQASVAARSWICQSVKKWNTCPVYGLVGCYPLLTLIKELDILTFTTFLFLCQVSLFLGLVVVGLWMKLKWLICVTAVFQTMLARLFSFICCVAWLFCVGCYSKFEKNQAPDRQWRRCVPANLSDVFCHLTEKLPIGVCLVFKHKWLS